MIHFPKRIIIVTLLVFIIGLLISHFSVNSRSIWLNIPNVLLFTIFCSLSLVVYYILEYIVVLKKKK